MLTQGILFDEVDERSLTEQVQQRNQAAEQEAALTDTRRLADEQPAWLEQAMNRSNRSGNILKEVHQVERQHRVVRSGLRPLVVERALGKGHMSHALREGLLPRDVDHVSGNVSRVQL